MTLPPGARSNLTLELQAGVVLQARRHWYHIAPQKNSAGGIMLLKVDGTSNVRILGRGSGEQTAALRMWRSGSRGRSESSRRRFVDTLCRESPMKHTKRRLNGSAAHG
jgi:hypothetical protein